MQTSYKATGLLGICALGAMATTYWQNTTDAFVAGLFAHGFLAAVVGGLADWFAVTALFRKPLGIQWCTDILRRNRARIEKELIEFISSDLLSRQNIMAVLKETNFSQMLIHYLTKHGGVKHLHALFTTFVEQAVRGIDVHKIICGLEKPVRNLLATMDVHPLIQRGIFTLQEEHNRKRIIKDLVPVARRVISDSAFQNILLTHITSMRKLYEGESLGRSALFSVLDLSDKRLLFLANQKAAEWLGDIERGQGESWKRLNEWVMHILESGEKHQNLRLWAEEWKSQQLSSINIAGVAQNQWSNILAEQLPVWIAGGRQRIEEYIQELTRNDVWQQKLNDRLLAFFGNMVDKHYAQIPALIGEYLQKLSDDELVALAESRVADDLQMIRINGSLVGALVGMALYVFTYFVNQVGGGG